MEENVTREEMLTSNDFKDATIKSKFDFRKYMTTQNKIIVCAVIAVIGWVILH